jgi:type III restriction enzyme
MAWFKSIEDIHNRLKQKGCGAVPPSGRDGHAQAQQWRDLCADGGGLPTGGSDFAKRGQAPGAARRRQPRQARGAQSAKYTEKYADYINLGVIEWRKAYAEHEKLGKKAILFVMTDDTRNCDDVAEYLEGNYPDLKGRGAGDSHQGQRRDFRVNIGQSKEELEKLRQQANAIDSLESTIQS